MFFILLWRLYETLVPSKCLLSAALKCERRFLSVTNFIDVVKTCVFPKCGSKWFHCKKKKLLPVVAEMHKYIFLWRNMCRRDVIVKSSVVDGKQYFLGTKFKKVQEEHMRFFACAKNKPIYTQKLCSQRKGKWVEGEQIPQIKSDF